MQNSAETNTKMQEIDIIQRAQKGEQAAFNLLVENHLKLVFNFAYKYFQSSAEAEDATQETFLKVWKNFQRFDSSKNFRTWLLVICKNTCLDMLKKRRPVSFSYLSDKNGSPLSPEEIPSTCFSENVSYSLGTEPVLNKKISELPKEYQNVIYLKIQKDLTFKQIAAATNKSINTVKSQYSRAVAALKKHFPTQNN